MAGGTVKYTLVLQSDQFQSAAKAALGEWNKMVSGITAQAGSLGNVLDKLGPIGIGAAAGIGAIGVASSKALSEVGAMVKEFVEFGDKIGTLSERTQLGAVALQRFNELAAVSGTSLEAVAKGATKMEEALGKGSTAFQRLGLDAAQLKKDSPEDAMKKVAEAISRINDEAGKAAAVKEIFGKTGAELRPLLDDLASGKTKVDEFGLALSDASIRGAKALSDQGAQLNKTWEATKHQFADAVIQTGALQKALELTSNAAGRLGQWFRDNKTVIKIALQEMAEEAEKFVAKWAALLPGGSLAAGIGGLIGGRLGQGALSVGAGGGGPGGSAPSRGSLFGKSSIAYQTEEEMKRAAAELQKLDALAAEHTRTMMAAETSLLRALNKFDEEAAAITNRNMADEIRRMGPIRAAELGLGPVTEINTSAATDALGRMMGSTLSGPLGGAAARKFRVDWISAIQDVANQLIGLLGLFHGKGASAGAGIGGTLGGAAGFALGGPIGGAIGGTIGSLLGGLVGSIFGHDNAKARAEQRKKDQEDATKGLQDLIGKWEQFRSETLAKGSTAVQSLFGYMIKSTDQSAEHMQRLGTIGLAVFESMRKSGMSLIEALNAMGPGLDEAIKAAGGDLSKLGPLAGLAGFRDLVNQFPELVQAAESLGDALNAVRVTGSLTRETLKQFGDEATAMFSELISKGFSTDQAIAIMGPTLLAISKAAQQFGLDATQMLDAITGGHGKEAADVIAGMQDPMDQLIELTKLQVEVMALLAKAFGVDIPPAIQAMIDKINQIPTQVSVGVDVHYNDPGDPNLFPDVPMTASGGVFTRPQVRLIGEAGPEAVIPLSRPDRAADVMAQAGLGGFNIHGDVHLHGVQDPEQFAEQLRALARNDGQTMKALASGIARV